MTALNRRSFVYIFILALLLRVGYLADIHGTAVSQWHTWTKSDMDTFLTGARLMQVQGILVPLPYHPYDKIQEITGSFDQWERWLGGEHAFYRAPGYYYFLATILALTRDSVLAVQLVQAVLGAGHAVLLGLVGARIMGHRLPGIVIGLLAATYGPFIANEAMILREGPGLFLAAAALYLVVGASSRSAEGSSRGSRVWWWLSAGMVFGVGSLLKETGLTLFGGIWLWALVQSFRTHAHLPRFAPWVLLIGFVISQAPFALRNILVGAPLLAPSVMFSWGFAMANTSDHPGGGVGHTLTAGVAKIMTGADARLPEVIRLTWQSYDGQHAQFFLNWLGRVSAVWSNIEISDNFSYDFLTLHSALLSMLPRFVCIWLPALMAFCLLGWHWIHKNAEPFHLRFAPKTFSLLLVCLAVTALPVSLTFVGSRYRMTVVPFLMLLAGWTLAQMMLWLLQRRIRNAASLGTALVCLSTVFSLLPTDPNLEMQATRPIDFVIAAAFFARQENEAGTRGELERGFQFCRQLPDGQPRLKAECTESITQAWLAFFGEQPETSY